MVQEVSVEALTMFSFEEIIREIEAKRASARADRDSWDRLLRVASDLAGSTVSEGNHGIAEKSWQLEQIVIYNYRGISNNDPLRITFDPTPGITVLHGLNGAGKSSVSDAIELGLSGTVQAKIGGTAGKAALWEPTHLARGAESARVEVTLTTGNERLVLETVMGHLDNIESHSAKIMVGNAVENVNLDDSWYQALISHQPVFAYAALERRVQLSKDLASYFEGLLALGGSFTAIHDQIAERGKASRESLDRWCTARATAMQSLANIDAQRGPNAPSVSLAPVPEPSIGSDQSEWLSRSSLLEEGIDSESLPENAKERIIASATQVLRSIRRFERSTKIAEQLLAGVLEQLYKESVEHGISDDECPVCATPNSSWLSSLEAAVARNRSIASLRDKVRTDIKVLVDEGHDILGDILKFGLLDPENCSIKDKSEFGSKLLDQFNSAVRFGVDAQSSIITAATRLSEWLCSTDAEILIDTAVEHTDAIKQWRLARSNAVQGFVAVWNQEGALASEAPLWAKTSKRVEDIRKHLRMKRSHALEGRAGERVKDLLADADLQLKKINLWSTKASMELIDGNGAPVDLGMLSAGQRNAVLLAPLLASVDAGPFGFLILDDPVHAFDELRIDRLSDAISKLAETRRVVVLTHDDRLKENLAARSAHCDTRLVNRSVATGEVQIADSSHFWEQLLNDAHQIYDVAEANNGELSDITEPIRALCRISIDNAIRTFIMRNAAVYGRDTKSDLESIDNSYTTEKRLQAAKGLWAGAGDENPADRAIDECMIHLGKWNQAVHGNEPNSVISKDEIKVARKACKALVAI
ncbi:AAA family ATPase [Glutamicibacter arilaitensis]|uniref:AAA family ATPase n=2 Tax=Glutamicibacter arilaitensis TaxID=256701 RepID=UPI003FCF34A7